MGLVVYRCPVVDRIHVGRMLQKGRFIRRIGDKDVDYIIGRRGVRGKFPSKLWQFDNVRHLKEGQDKLGRVLGYREKYY